MVSYSVMTLADTLFVARLGSGPLAGVGLGGTAAFAVLVFALGLLRGVKILTSQAQGARSGGRGQAIVGAGLVLAVLLGAAAIAAGLAVAQLLPLIASSAAAGTEARNYLEVRILGAPLLSIFVALRESRYGRGDSHSPMVAGVLANVVNVGLDAWFVLGLEWGVRGAAAASVMATTVQALLLVALEARRGFGLREVRVEEIFSLLRVGVPTGVQFVLEMGSFSLLTVFLARMPELELAAHQIALQVIHFTFLPTLAVSESVSVLVGQAIGARRVRLVQPLAHRGLALAGAWAGLCTLLLVGFGGLISSAFTNDAPLAARATQLLMVAAVFQIFDGAGVVGRGALRGAGDVRAPAVVGVLTAWLFTPPLTWWLGLELGWGAVGGWVGLCIEIGIASAFFWFRLWGRGWWGSARRTRALAAA
jgi:MATE family multidrug resistance protein